MLTLSRPIDLNEVAKDVTSIILGKLSGGVLKELAKVVGLH